MAGSVEVGKLKGTTQTQILLEDVQGVLSAWTQSNPGEQLVSVVHPKLVDTQTQKKSESEQAIAAILRQTNPLEQPVDAVQDVCLFVTARGKGSFTDADKLKWQRIKTINNVEQEKMNLSDFIFLL